jgi:hypothetical protein
VLVFAFLSRVKAATIVCAMKFAGQRPSGSPLTKKGYISLYSMVFTAASIDAVPLFDAIRAVGERHDERALVGITQATSDNVFGHNYQTVSETVSRFQTT